MHGQKLFYSLCNQRFALGGRVACDKYYKYCYFLKEYTSLVKSLLSDLAQLSQFTKVLTLTLLYSSETASEISTHCKARGNKAIWEGVTSPQRQS